MAKSGRTGLLASLTKLGLTCMTFVAAGNPVAARDCWPDGYYSVGPYCTEYSNCGECVWGECGSIAFGDSECYNSCNEAAINYCWGS